MDEVDMPSAIEPSEWFVVFNEKSASRLLGLITLGRFKHVSAFGYCPGVKVWLLYDVQLSATRLMLMDKAAVMAWSSGCTVVRIVPPRQRMGWSSRAGFTCVNAVKHLIGLRCVAITPTSLYRHILRNGGIVISGSKHADAASRSDARAGAAAGAG
jgi:hypothetical protein